MASYICNTNFFIVLHNNILHFIGLFQISFKGDYGSIVFNIYVDCLMVSFPSHIFLSNAEITNLIDFLRYVIFVVNTIHLFYDRL